MLCCYIPEKKKNNKERKQNLYWERNRITINTVYNWCDTFLCWWTKDQRFRRAALRAVCAFWVVYWTSVLACILSNIRQKRRIKRKKRIVVQVPVKKIITEELNGINKVNWAMFGSNCGRDVKLLWLKSLWGCGDENEKEMKNHILVAELFGNFVNRL